MPIIFEQPRGSMPHDAGLSNIVTVNKEKIRNQALGSDLHMK
jgi:hypothetical protein